LTNAAFRFVVDIGGDGQGVFTECTLPVIEWEVEEVKEGGLNVFTHQLPGRRKAVKITLKNGVGTSQLMEWYLNIMSEKFSRRPVTVTLYNASHDPVLTWHMEAAYPVKWTGPQLKTSENSIAIQTLELACGEITISKSGKQ
jgi:phage tail-like protein